MWWWFKSYLTLAIHQAALSMGIPRQESWSWLPFPSPGNLPNPEVKPTSPSFQVDSLLLSKVEKLFFFFKGITADPSEAID